MAKETKPESKNQTSSTTSASRLGERRKERERESRRNSILIGVGVVVAVVALILFGIWLGNRPVEAPIPESATTAYTDLPTSRSRDGYPRIGNPDAPVQVLLYSSFDCETCAPFIDGLREPLMERVRNEDVTVTFVPLYGFGDITNGHGAARAAMCALEQGQFWPYMAALYNWQQFGNQAYINSRILSGAEALGMDRGAFTACSLGGAPDGPLTAARNQSRALLGFTTPPAAVINGVLLTGGDDNAVVTDPELVIGAVDRAISNLIRPNRGQPDAEATAEATPEVTDEAEIETTAEVTEAATEEPEIVATQSAEETPEATVEAGD